MRVHSVFLVYNFNIVLFFNPQNQNSITYLTLIHTLTLKKSERVGRLKHFSISCMLPQTHRESAPSVLSVKHQHCIQKQFHTGTFFILPWCGSMCVVRSLYIQ